MAKRLRDHGLQSERLLWPTKGPSQFEEDLGVDELEHALGLTTLEKAVRWAQTKSMWPDTFGLACCAIEMMSIVSARYDIARFGMEAFRSSPACRRPTSALGSPSERLDSGTGLRGAPRRARDADGDDRDRANPRRVRARTRRARLRHVRRRRRDRLPRLGREGRLRLHRH